MRNAAVSAELCRYSGSICCAAMYTVSCCTCSVLRSVMLRSNVYGKLFQNLNACFSTGYGYNMLTIGDRACA